MEMNTKHLGYSKKQGYDIDTFEFIQRNDI